ARNSTPAAAPPPVEPSRRPPCLHRSNPGAARLMVEPSRCPPCEATPRNLRAHAPPPHFRPCPRPPHFTADTNLADPIRRTPARPDFPAGSPLRNGGTPAETPPGTALVRHDLTCRAARPTPPGPASRGAPQHPRAARPHLTCGAPHPSPLAQPRAAHFPEQWIRHPDQRVPGVRFPRM